MSGLDAAGADRSAGPMTALRWAGGLVVVVLVLFGVVVGVEINAWFIPVIVAAAVGFFLSGRVPGNALAWVWLALGVVGLTSGVALGLADQRLAEGIVDIGTGWMAWLAWVTWFPTLTLTLMPLLLFPHGLWTPAWRWVLGAMLAGSGVLTVLSAVQPRLELSEYGVSLDNPLVPQSWTWVPSSEESALAVAALALLGLSTAAAAVGVVLRAVRSDGVERRQLRWFAFAAGMVGVVALLNIAAADLLSRLAVAQAVLPVTVAFLPVACAIAITRHGLYEIDRLISRSVSYLIVTALVVAVYSLVVTSVSRLLPVSSTLAVATATLAAAGIVRPVRRHVQSAVDRRFNRERYDAARTVESFARGLRDEVDPDAAAAAVVDTIAATLQPSSVALWMRGDS